MIELLKELAIKSSENAEELYDEAEILLEKEKYARSFFLIQIAGEELGKHIMCVGAIVQLAIGKFDFKKFKKSFYNHREKTQSIDVFEKFILKNTTLSSFNTIQNDANLFEDVKLMSLYCGFIETNAFKPSEVINKDLVEININILNKRLKLIKSMGIVKILKTTNELPIEKIKSVYNKYFFKIDKKL